MKIICTQEEFIKMANSCSWGDCYQCVFDHFCKSVNYFCANPPKLEIEITDSKQERE